MQAKSKIKEQVVMPLTVKEVTQKIDGFLQYVSQRYVLQIQINPEVIETQSDNDLIKEEFKKVIFADQNECIEAIAKLPTNLVVEAQQLRLLLTSAELNLCNTKYPNVNASCIDELSKALEFGNISENLQHKLAYVSLAYYLCYMEKDITKQQALNFFTDTKNFLQQRNIPHLLTMDVEFIKLYYSFSILSSSFAPKDTEIHKLYDDLPLDSRFENSKFMLRIDCIIRAIPYMTWIDLQAKKAIVAAYSMISKSSYEKDEFCEPIQIGKAIDFINAAINKNIDLFAKETIKQDKVQANQYRRIYIAELQLKIQQVEEWGTSEFTKINAYWDTVQQQEISHINAVISQAKLDANRKAFSNTLKQAVGMAAGCFAGPAACGALATSAGISTAVTSAAITGATQVAITGGNFRDILKSATIGGITGGVMSKVPVSGELVGVAKRIEGAKLGILNSSISTVTSTIVLGKGKLDPTAMLGAGLAGAGGVNMKGLAKDLTERAIKDATITAIHGGKLISNLAIGAIESSAGHFGKTMGEEFKYKIEVERALSKANPVLEQKSNKEGAEQQKAFKEKAKEESDSSVNQQVKSEDLPNSAIASSAKEEVALKRKLKGKDRLKQVSTSSIQEEHVASKIISENSKEALEHDLDPAYSKIALNRNPILGEQAAAEFLYHLTSFITTDAYANDLSVPTSSTSSFTDSSINSYLDIGFGEKLLILSGGGIKGVWRGIKQGSCMAGESLGILASGTVANYTNQKNQEMQLYNSTLVGRSKLRPWVEFVTETLLYSAIPVVGYGRMGLVANSALTGGVIGGLQFVDDGQASRRFINAGAGGVVGAGIGVAANSLRRSLLKLYDLCQTRKFNHYVSEVGFSSEEKFMQHFSEHASEFKYTNKTEYLQGARDVMNNGYSVKYSYKGEKRTGYVKFMGNTHIRTLDEIINNIPKIGKHREGTIKFEFVGTNTDGNLTTYHVKNSKELFKLLNGNKLYEMINDIPKATPR
ncbi:MAG: hypothetical protein ACR2HS_01845 [Gammaproteobacteria bacterium]